MQNKIILAALLLALSTSAAVAQSESSSRSSTTETEASPAVVSEGTEIAATTATPTDTAKGTGAASAKSAKPEAKPKEEKPKAKATKTSSKSSSSSSDRLGDAGKFVANGTKRVVATMAGFAIGMPIATLRMAYHEDGEQAKCLPWLSESEKPPLVFVSRVLFIPTAAFSGIFQAPVYSATNAWRESDENPFSKESIFLGDYDERASTQ